MSTIRRIGKGLVALVTGGASGLGKATVERLAINCTTVFAIDLPDSIHSVHKHWHFPPEYDLHYRAADVTDEAQVSKVIEEIRGKHKRLDYLVTCAGIFEPQPAYHFDKNKPQSMDDFTRTFNVNVFGTFNVIRLAVGLMKETKPHNGNEDRGVIVTVSSIARDDGPADHAAYSASKAAVAGLTVPLAREFGPLGIRVVSIAPGPMYTPLLARAGQAVEKCPQSTIFPQRLGQPEEFARIVEFILENPFVNATTISFDAGYRNPGGSTFSNM
ncbi:3-hydroxyacyl-CoA dehydrogenase type-2-like [Paramacrobiotus metropolitanus]|uniref:3-hydroxyacyl-CoA dehydrogenase type-2-like n=1 Tax=Paramacrobiotus metropolitanus TaxID=2943436 RepID=UPI002445DCB9|nr:3-hydroxyacyl-CoA dehydrogenase type-2-like [Paramacrobiotus metropolitanus]